MSTLPRTVGEFKALPAGTVVHSTQGLYFLKATPSTSISEGVWIQAPDSAHRLSPAGQVNERYESPPGLHTDAVYPPEAPGLFLILVEMAEIKVKPPRNFTGQGQTAVEVWIPLPHDATAQGILLQDAAKHESAVLALIKLRADVVERDLVSKDFTLSGPWAVATFLKEEAPVRSNPKRFPGGSVGDEPIIVPIDANTQIEIVQSGRKLFAVTLTDPQEGWSLDEMFWVDGSLEDAKEEGRQRAKQLNIKTNPRESSYDSDGVKQITIQAYTRQTPERPSYPVYLLRLTRTARKSWQPYVVGYEIYDKHPYEDQQARLLGEGGTIDEAIKNAQSAIYVRYSD